MMKNASRKGRVMLVASQGGHWKQLEQLKDCYKDQKPLFISTRKVGPVTSGCSKIVRVGDCNARQIGKVLLTLIEAITIVRRIRPAVVLSTGAAPGLLFILVARIYGAKTIWVDSIANSENLSLSGRIAARVASVTFTQWEHLARSNRVVYAGSIL